MSTVKVTRRAGVRIPGLGSREYGETFEVDQQTARQLDALDGLEWVKASSAKPAPEPEPEPVAQPVEIEDSDGS